MKSRKAEKVPLAGAEGVFEVGRNEGQVGSESSCRGLVGVV